MAGGKQNVGRAILREAGFEPAPACDPERRLKRRLQVGLPASQKGQDFGRTTPGFPYLPGAAAAISLLAPENFSKFLLNRAARSSAARS